MAPSGAMFFFLLILGLSSNPGEPLRPCCLNDGSCFDLTEALCATVGGTVSKASSCADAQCEAVGACCTAGLNCASPNQSATISAELGWAQPATAFRCHAHLRRVLSPRRHMEDADLCREAGGFPRGLETAMRSPAWNRMCSQPQPSGMCGPRR